MRDDAVCLHCNKAFEIENEDYSQHEEFEEQCPHCHRYLEIMVEYIVTYDVLKKIED
jgi:Zn finger protein HypA/HybF involved in hydrogenase expression